jgi:two-component sensor histidine kinase
MTDSDPIPDEVHRLDVLRSYRILDTPPEMAFDDATHMARHVCAAPMALVTLVDGHRQWFKSRPGLDLQETELESSVCAHAIREPDVLVVPDLSADPRFAGMRLVTGAPHLRFYAGVPLRTGGGLALGTLCVLDTRPRTLDEQQIDMLCKLARQVMSLLDLRKITADHAELLQEQQRAQEAKEELVHELQHRFKNCLQTIDSLVSLQSRREPSAEGRDAIARMRDRLRPIYLIQDRLQADAMEMVDLRAYLHDVIRCVAELHRSRGVQGEVDEDMAALELARERALPLGLIVSEFLSNSFRHGFRPNGGRAGIELRLQGDGRARLEMSDNGPGFEPMPRAAASGLGLQLITALSGQVGAKPRWENRDGARLVLEFALR